MLGFEVQGGWRDVKTSVVMTALQYLMGGGGSFSAGGPGTALGFTLVADLPLSMNHSQLEAQVQLFTPPLVHTAFCICLLRSVSRSLLECHFGVIYLSSADVTQFVSYCTNSCRPQLGSPV